MVTSLLRAFAGVLFGVHALQFRRIPDALKRQADRAAEAGKLDVAVRYLRQYLEFKPEANWVLFQKIVCCSFCLASVAYRLGFGWFLV